MVVGMRGCTQKSNSYFFSIYNPQRIFDRVERRFKK